MAISGVMRPGIIQIRVLDMPAAVEHYTKRIGFYQVTEGADGRVYLKSADEFDHHSLALRRAENAGVDFIAFKVRSDADLDRYQARVKETGAAVDHVAAGEQPGVGRRIGFTIPTGHRVELYAQADASSPAPDIKNPDVWSVEPKGMRAQCFDHALFYGPNIDATRKFFVEALDFDCAERVDTPDGAPVAIFMTCGMKAHDIAFVDNPEGGKLHHISFRLDNWVDVGHAADMIAHYDMPIDIGPTRHGITRGQTIYFFDPSGNRNEVFSGGYTYYPDHPTRIWDAEQLGKAIFYYQRELNERFLTVLT
jgi:catechol 2,3-dioxygenase